MKALSKLIWIETRTQLLTTDRFKVYHKVVGLLVQSAGRLQQKRVVQGKPVVRILL